MALGTETALAAGALAGKAALKKVLDRLLDDVKDEAKKKLRHVKNESVIGKLYTQLAKVRKVKTLGQLDKAVDLTEFYCDSHVYIAKSRRRIQSLSDFGTDDNLVIEGIAGQGKSIFLRYLCSVEAMMGQHIPVFAELRRIQKSQKLTDFLIEILQEFHIDAKNGLFSELANTGRLVLLLDAFDEVRDDEKSRIIEEIEHLTTTHEKLRLVITSRPESGIETCPHFHVIKLSNLEKDEYLNVIYKIGGDSELSEQLITQIRQHKGGIKSLLITPLLVTLLVINYKSFQQLPEQLSDFYESLFEVLLQRHDGIKPGYRRARGCAMNDHQYRQVFESFCFISKRHEGRQLKSKDVYLIGEQALKDRRITVDPDKFVSDIVKITCLLVKDGEEYRFIHKSVQEYYAAAYLKEKPDILIKDVYPKLFLPGESWHYRQELRFIEEIDSYRYQKYGQLPYLLGLFSISEQALLTAPTNESVKVIENILNETEVVFLPGKENDDSKGIRYVGLDVYRSEIATILDENITYPIFCAKTDISLKDNQRPIRLQDAIDKLTFDPKYKLNIPKAAALIARFLFARGKAGLQEIVDEERPSVSLTFSSSGEQ